ncbi:hypothetical protein [Nocardia yamanashiensis]|uniref:hypothetical protein n=1 Tax=Nocardia yamanashiensis TaxID=209247 RepID=UPI000A5813D4|nr:hypothetical protein [Nocardia yamanashiensis]
MTGAPWEELPLRNRQVREILYSGNGKDADLIISFADGSTGTIPSHHVSITSSAPIQMTIVSEDDLNLAVRITGVDLAVASAKVVNYDFDDAEYGPRFQVDIAKWATPGRHGIGIVTPVELELSQNSRP